jgi:hypothetical protein
MPEFITKDGVHYTANRAIRPTDTRTPPRPSSEHYWVDGGWVFRGERERWLNEHIRPERDRLIKETIWIAERQSTAPSDKKMSDANYQLWVSYWQALRDLPEVIDIDDPQFPTQPEISWTGIKDIKVSKKILGMG